MPQFFGYGIAVEDLRNPNEELKARWAELNKARATDSEFKDEIAPFLKDFIRIVEAEETGKDFTAIRGKDIYNIDDIDLAFATYIVYTMSRDGMGKEFTEYKFKDTGHYHKRAESLFACAERLEGIEVQQLDAFMFFRKGTELMEDEKTTYQAIGDWLNNPSVMMYLDPSYIQPESEREALKGIDWQRVDSLSEAVRDIIKKEKEEKKRRKKAGENVEGIKIRKMPQNLGEVYARSFNYEEQENFLRLICNAKCKILISNYDLILYDKYLTMNGWHRTEFITSTSVGSQAGNDRTEVIWWNY